MKKLYFLSIILALGISCYGQTPAKQAYLGEDGQSMIREIMIDEHLTQKSPGKDYSQVQGWPKKFANNPTFKSMRGICIADIDLDGIDDIVFGIHNRLYAYKGDGTLIWQKTLTGSAIYPPSIADVTGNGIPEIVQVTGGLPNNGRVYVVNNQGEDLAGWPVNFNNNWILCAPALADLNNDNKLEIIVNIRTLNQIHVLKYDGSSFGPNWPVSLGGIPAVTPSVGDINKDGSPEIIVAISAGTIFALKPDGSNLEGFPIVLTDKSFSYQSPLLADLDGDGFLSIIGATHGNAPEFFVRNHTGSYRTGWPFAIPDNNWTYFPPTVVKLPSEESHRIFMARPVSEDPLPMLWSFSPEASILDDYPITKAGGLEGFLSVADIDADGAHDIIFGSNLMVEGQGFIHAYKMDGSGQLPGFPLRPTGFTFMNGPNLGDVTGDGMLNLIALSYEQSFQTTDSTFINVYNLNIPVEQANVLFGTYKGSNTRNGLMSPPSPPVPPDSVKVQWIQNYDHDQITAIDLWFNNQKILSNSVFQSASNWMNFPVGEAFDLSLTPTMSTDTTNALLRKTFTLESEKQYYLIFNATNDKTGADIWIYDQAKYMAANPENLELMFVHAAANTPDYIVEYYLPNNAIVEINPFAFGNFYGYHEVAPVNTSIVMNKLNGEFYKLYSTLELETMASRTAMFIYSGTLGDTKLTYPNFYVVPPDGGNFIEVTLLINSLNEVPKGNEKLIVFPNPAKDHLTVRTESFNLQNSKVFIVDLPGRQMEVPCQVHSQNEISMQIQGLAKGAYLLIIKTPEGTHKQKFFKY